MSIDRPLLRIGRYRWVICALLFAATAINYIDRQTIGVLKPTLQAELHWTESSYADIVLWFQCAYAIGYLGFGRIIDRIGARLGYAVAYPIDDPAKTQITDGVGALKPEDDIRDLK